MKVSRDYSRIRVSGLEVNDPLPSTPYDDIPVKPDVDEFCWSHFGWGGENLAKRYHYEKDQVIKDTEVYTIYQLGNTNYQYRVRETSRMPGIIIDAIWKDEEE